MIIWKNKLIPFKGYKIFNSLGLILFVRSDAKTPVTEININHEKIHSAQMLETLWIGFYLWYVIEYLCIWISKKYNKQNHRYHDVSFEEEAHNNDTNLDYLKTRKHYAWLKYIKLGSYKNN